MTDFHIHLARLAHPDKVLEALKSRNCDVFTIACEPWEWEKTLELKDLFPGSFASIAFGIHPMIASQVSEKDFCRLEQILQSGNYAVGECGMDKRFPGYEKGGIQESVFTRQIELARNLDRDLQIHCVGDYGRVMELLRDQPLQAGKIIFHRFGGDLQIVRAATKMKAVFSLHEDSFRKKSTLASIQLMHESDVRFETDADESFEGGEAPEETAGAIVRKLEIVHEKWTNTKGHL